MKIRKVNKTFCVSIPKQVALTLGIKEGDFAQFRIEKPNKIIMEIVIPAENVDLAQSKYHLEISPSNSAGAKSTSAMPNGE